LAEAPPGDATGAQALLQASAEAHGLAAYRQIHDINVGYEGEWRPFIDRIQPVVVDKGFRSRAQDRLLPQAGVVAQHHVGAAGHKHVFWRRGAPPRAAEVTVAYNGQASADAAVLAASAVVAECYGVFLLGPLWLAGRALNPRRAGTERVDGRLCDVVDVWLRPGLGLSALDRLSLCIDPGSGLMRRVRFTLEGFESTQGAVAQTDTFDHERRFGVMWPMRSYEEVVHPLRLPAHDWRIVGLDVDRGHDEASLRGMAFSGLAAAPAQPL
jgi:hypothetical protein